MRFSYALVALIGAAHAMPHVGSLVTGRSVCNDASANCKGVARAVVADQAALDARKKSRQAKSSNAANNATAAAAGEDGAESNNDKRSKKLAQVEARANQTAEARRSLGDVVDGAVGDVTGAVGDVTDTVGLKTRDGKEVRAAGAGVTDDAALDAREKNKEAQSAAAANGTAEARSITKKAANDTADAAAEARKTRRSSKSRKPRRSHQLW
ncbi:hypothetical protein F5883DRAFT_715050 [Diaporthe sp. PMI_573]|nr:hypothetical protein F5883DRAFT_715050 [Diaporthaceae sp. PMI_573]